ncbi:MAG: leucine-rich repeat domain-containing protein, partial [Salinivirgaceae bacterium]|nr:leucine-rich repeat domain-containing protein [Salinivirgaceae bacterium]
MKRILALLVAATFAAQTWAQTSFEVNGLKYTITDAEKHEVSVGIISDDNKPQGNLIIPAEVENDGVKFAVTEIGYRAFYDCTGLTSVTIPNSVKNIDYLAFQNCVGLTSVTIPNSVTNIGGTAFADCQKLTEIKVDGDNSNYTSENGVLLSKGRDILICCPIGKTGPYTIPNSVTDIGWYAFLGCSGLTSVTIGNSVTTIGERAFYGCSSLETVTIGNSVTRIGDYAFYECSSLTKAEFASVESLCKMEFVDYSSNPLTYANHLYINGEEVTEVSIPNS